MTTETQLRPHSNVSVLNAQPPLLGHTVPRLFTPPLRELTPQTSYGYSVIDFAREVLREPLDPWEEWVVIHAGELLEDGRPRFRHVLILVARQNGKTHLLKVLALYWLFVEDVQLILGTSTNLVYAREAWQKTVDMAETITELAPYRGGVRKANGDIALRTSAGGRYMIAASNRKGGRSMSIDRLVQDELREHHNWEAWDAATNAMNARPFAQSFNLSNMGDDKSVVLDSLRDSALSFINTGYGDQRFGLFEWSAKPGADVMDPQAWAAANPNLGYRIDVDAIAGAAARAAEKGGKEESGFRTEILCQRVRSLDAAVDPRRWEELYARGDLSHSELRSRIAVCLDVSPDRLHATLAAAAVLRDGKVRVEVVDAWGPSKDAPALLRKALPGWLQKLRPQTIGWMPNGPTAVLAADFTPRPGIWPPPGSTATEIKQEVSAVCMGFAEQVVAGQIVHSNDLLLNAHVTGAAKLWTGDVWKFSRKGEGHCDAAYAAAGAVHLARTLPKPIGKPRLLIAKDA